MNKRELAVGVATLLGLTVGVNEAGSLLGHGLYNFRQSSDSVESAAVKSCNVATATSDINAAAFSRGSATGVEDGVSYPDSNINTKATLSTNFYTDKSVVNLSKAVTVADSQINGAIYTQAASLANNSVATSASVVASSSLDVSVGEGSGSVWQGATNTSPASAAVVAVNSRVADSQVD